MVGEQEFAEPPPTISSRKVPGMIVGIGTLSYIAVLLPRWFQIQGLSESGPIALVDILLIIGGALLVAVGIFFLMPKKHRLLPPPSPIPDLKEIGNRYSSEEGEPPINLS